MRRSFVGETGNKFETWRVEDKIFRNERVASQNGDKSIYSGARVKRRRGGEGGGRRRIRRRRWDGEEEEELAEGKIAGGSQDTHVIVVATVKLIATHTQWTSFIIADSNSSYFG